MKASLNKIFLIGSIAGKIDSVPRVDNSQYEVFVVLTDESYINKYGDMITKNERHIVLIPTSGTQFEELFNGATVFVEGKIVTQKIETENKLTTYQTEIIAHRVVLLNCKISEIHHKESSSQAIEYSNCNKQADTVFGFDSNFPTQSSDMDKIPF